MKMVRQITGGDGRARHEALSSTGPLLCPRRLGRACNILSMCATIVVDLLALRLFVSSRSPSSVFPFPVAALLWRTPGASRVARFRSRPCKFSRRYASAGGTLAIRAVVAVLLVRNGDLFAFVNLY